MKINSTTLFLESPNAITSIPFDSKPDFSAFTEPTLSVLQKAWSDFLESGEELEIIPDPEIIEEPPKANWDMFNLQMMSSPRFNEVYNQCNQYAPLVATALPVSIDQVTTKGLSLFTLVWNQLCQIGGATTEDRTAWGELALANNLPQDFIGVLRG